MALSDTRRRLVARLHRRKTREREALVLVEGVRAVDEALAQGARPRFVLRTPDVAVTPDLSRRLAAVSEVQEVTEEEMVGLSGTETPQGVLLVAEEPSARPDEIFTSPEARIVVLDGVQDPGNAGTLVRVAAAFGCTALVALDGTVDLWSPKVLRASAGTAFRLPLLHRPWSEVEGWLEDWPGKVFEAAADGVPVDAVEMPGAWALALGGEGGGCRDAVRRRADGALSIPMPGGVESLNVGIAGSLLLYELTRSRGRGPHLRQETA